MKTQRKARNAPSNVFHCLNISIFQLFEGRLPSLPPSLPSSLPWIAPTRTGDSTSCQTQSFPLSLTSVTSKAVRAGKLASHHCDICFGLYPTLFSGKIAIADWPIEQSQLKLRTQSSNDRTLKLSLKNLQGAKPLAGNTKRPNGSFLLALRWFFMAQGCP